MNLNALEPFPRLETKRLVLNQLVKGDVEQLLEINSFNDRAKTEEELDQLLALADKGIRSLMELQSEALAN